MSVLRTPLAPGLTRLRVEGNRAPITLHVDPSRDQRHSLGIASAPRFLLHQPLSPDDGWRVDVAPDGRTLPPDPSGEGMLALLPDGDYVSIDTPRLPQPAPRFMLGNEWVPARPHMGTLSCDGDAFCGVLGANADAPPCFAGPLLGVTILSYTGNSSPQGVLFFSFYTEDLRTDRIRLLLPLSGALVFDNLLQYGGDARVAAAWADRVGVEVARRLG